MSGKQNTPWSRTVAAYGVLRGRPPQPDCGLLLVLPVVAAAAGALAGLSVDVAVTDRRSARRTGIASGRAAVPETRGA